MNLSSFALPKSPSSESLGATSKDSKIASARGMPAADPQNGVSNAMAQGIDQRPSSVPLQRRAPVMVSSRSYDALPIAQLPMRGRSDSLESNQSIGSNSSLSSHSLESQPLSKERCLQKIAQLRAELDDYSSKPTWPKFADTLSGITRLSKRLPAGDSELQQHVTGLLTQLTRAQQSAQFRVNSEDEAGPSGREGKGPERRSSDDLEFNKGFAAEGMVSAVPVEYGEGGSGDLSIFNPFLAASDSGPYPSPRDDGKSSSRDESEPMQKSPTSPRRPAAFSFASREHERSGTPLVGDGNSSPIGRLDSKLTADNLDKCDLDDLRNPQHVLHKPFERFIGKEFATENWEFLSNVREFRVNLTPVRNDPHGPYAAKALLAGKNAAVFAVKSGVNLPEKQMDVLLRIASGAERNLRVVSEVIEAAHQEVRDMLRDGPLQRFKKLGIDGVKQLIDQ